MRYGPSLLALAGLLSAFFLLPPGDLLRDFVIIANSFVLGLNLAWLEER